MLNNIFTKNIEQNKHSDLSEEVKKITQKVAQKFANGGRMDDLKTRRNQIDFAHAVLHMRLYQHFGKDAHTVTKPAHSYLDELIDQEPLPRFLRLKTFVPPA